MTERKVSLTQKALKTRKRAKQKKPEFLRSESWRYTKLSESWRRPRGLDHKMRRKIKGWPPMVSTGYKGPKIARGLHPSGYREVLVHNMNEMVKIDPKTQAARIAHTVGRKKRTQIIAEARSKNVVVLNAKEVKETVVEGEEKPEEAEGVPTEEQEEEPEEVAEKPKKPARKAAVKKKAPVEEKAAEPVKKSEEAKEKVGKPKKTRKIAKTKEGEEQ
jgi:large subunit ribosomal protein L32e